jgi:subtilisin family serine protease
MSVRVAIIDSGVHAEHPHVNGVSGGIGIGYPDYIDRIGHGTAVTAAIREKAPDAELFAVKVFDCSLAAPIETLVAAIDWAICNRIRVVNLSLGTSNPEHEPVLRSAVARATEHRMILVSACEDAGVRWLPGSLPGVVPVALDWECPRAEYRAGPVFHASGYPRPIPGVDPARNLNGISFAVANMTGFVARFLEGQTELSVDQLVEGLMKCQKSWASLR